MRGTDGRRIDAVAIEGEPCEIGRQVAMRVISPVALQIANERGFIGVLHFYTALITHLLCDVKAALGGEVAEKIGTAALAQLPNIPEPSDSVVAH